MKQNKSFVKQQHKTILAYGGVAAFALFFSRVYAHFGHGVTSVSMANMWLWLLVLGSMVYALLELFCPQIRWHALYRLFCNLYNSGVAVLVNGMLLRGVLEVAGGYSGFVAWFTYCAAAFFAAAAVCFVFMMTARAKKKKL